MGRRKGWTVDAAGLLTGCACGQPDEAHHREPIPGGSQMKLLRDIVRQAQLRGTAPRAISTNREVYGDNGCGLHPAWACVRVFMRAVLDLGWKPGLTLERRDNGRGYFPDNLTLATPAEQSRNMRRNRRFSTGEIATDAARRLGFRTGKGVSHRIDRYGWSEAAALSTPAGAMIGTGGSWWKRHGRVESVDQFELTLVISLAETPPPDVLGPGRRQSHGPSARHDPRQLGLFPDEAKVSEKPMAASDTARRVRSAGKRSKPLPASSDNSILSNGQSGKPTAIR